MDIKNVLMLEEIEFSKMVSEHYGRPYDFQQQDGCKSRGTFEFKLPIQSPSDFKNDTVPEIVNHNEMGVSFKAWLERDPKQVLENKDDRDSWSLGLWWQRNFYPDVEMILDDLNKKGILPDGSYLINIDW